MTLLEGTNPASTDPHPAHGSNGHAEPELNGAQLNGNGLLDADKVIGPADASKMMVKADVEVLRDLITKQDKEEILRF